MSLKDFDLTLSRSSDVISSSESEDDSTSFSERYLPSSCFLVDAYIDKNCANLQTRRWRISPIFEVLALIYQLVSGFEIAKAKKFFNDFILLANRLSLNPQYTSHSVAVIKLICGAIGIVSSYVHDSKIKISLIPYMSMIDDLDNMELVSFLYVVRDAQKSGIVNQKIECNDGHYGVTFNGARAFPYFNKAGYPLSEGIVQITLLMGVRPGITFKEYLGPAVGYTDKQDPHWETLDYRYVYTAEFTKISRYECPAGILPVFHGGMDARTFVKLTQDFSEFFSVPETDHLINPLFGQEIDANFFHRVRAYTPRGPFFTFKMTHPFDQPMELPLYASIYYILAIPGFADYITMRTRGRYYLSPVDAFHQAINIVIGANTKES